MKDGEKMDDYIPRLLTLTNQMNKYGESLNEVKIIEKVLRILHPFFDHIVVTTKETKNLDNIKIEKLQSTLEAREMKVVEREIENQDKQSLLARFKKLEASKDKWKNRCKKYKSGEDKPETLSKNDGGHVKH